MERVEKDGTKNFNLQKNNLISKWSQIHEIILVTDSYEPTNEDNLRRVLNFV